MAGVADESAAGGGDLTGWITAAHAAGAAVVVDNTFSTPLRATPLRLGADIVVHSATKFLAGHSDVLAGVAVTADPDLAERLRRRRRLTGAVLGPFEAWLTLRGLRTLAVRLDRAEANAATLVARLAGHPAVSRVRYPGLSGQGATPLLRGAEQWRRSRDDDGPRPAGSMIAIEVAAGPPAADAVVAATRLWVPATSLGGVESLLERRRRHPNEPATVPENLLRLSVGIEDVDDLWADLRQALDRVTATR